ncbi:MAG: hypothetical protein EAY65_01430 [Alphaproteobacteria bacterium]|nr:MAG: hypothetical protein EAY65_01430 [Alphaproteobacteria bacterium]
MINPKTLVFLLQLVFVFVFLLYLPAISVFYELSIYVAQHISSLVLTLLLLALGYGFGLIVHTLSVHTNVQSTNAIAFNLFIYVPLGLVIAILIHAIIAHNPWAIIEGLVALTILLLMGILFICITVAIYCIFDD